MFRRVLKHPDMPVTGDYFLYGGDSLNGIQVLSELETILGVDNTRALMRFYGEDMLAMVMDVMPFVLEIIYPKVLASSKEAAKRTRRRHFFR